MTKATSIQAGMLPSCTVPKIVSMAPIVSYLCITLKFYERKYSFLHRSREYLFLWNCCCLLKWTKQWVPFKKICWIKKLKRVVILFAHFMWKSFVSSYLSIKTTSVFFCDLISASTAFFWAIKITFGKFSFEVSVSKWTLKPVVPHGKIIL